ncbi:MAG: superoxide dismutase [Leptospirales bacterium]|nr:superoxide dismutase [Leptospirales bacterium]
MALALPELPYAKNALEPHISANTLDFHHGKHHNAYVVNGNKLLEGTDLAGRDVEFIVKAAWEKKNQGLFNNAAQVWNHTFFWNSMKPNGGGAPSGAIGERIKADFGSVEKFAEEFKNAAVTQFGSGWAWLIEDGGKLSVMKTPNAENPMVHGKKALLTVDVWEHAYYLDYQNRRPDFVQTFIDKLINWDFVNLNLK